MKKREHGKFYSPQYRRLDVDGIVQHAGKETHSDQSQDRRANLGE